MKLWIKDLSKYGRLRLSINATHTPEIYLWDRSSGTGGINEAIGKLDEGEYGIHGNNEESERGGGEREVGDCRRVVN